MGRKREGNGMVRVRVLGAVELQIGHRRIGMNTEVLFGLALVLTTRAGERIPRDELLELLWAKGSEDQRRHALRQMLYRLRQKGLGLEEEGDKVMVEAARVDNDLRAALDPAWVDGATAEQVDAAATFGPTFSRRMAPGFVAWVDELRERLSHQHRKASLRQINIARREARWADLERWAQSVLKSDPLNEEATMARAESAAMAGSKTMAIEILDAYLAEVQPISPDLGKPALALRKRLAERRADWTLRGPKEVALVGREEVMSRLTGLVEAAWKGEGSSVVLVGAPGIGKTRLAREVQGYAELKGFRTIHVVAEPRERARPTALILALTERLVALPGAAGSAPEAMTFVSRVMATPYAGNKQMAASAESLVEEFETALQEIISAVAVECRLLILLDDLHNADAFSLSLLATLWNRFDRSRVLFVATSRGRIERTLPDGTSTRLWAQFHVPPLGREQTEKLVTAVLRAHRLAIDEVVLKGIVEASGGNPLFARELGAHRAGGGPSNTFPDNLKDLIFRRLGRVDTASLRALRVATLLGGAASLARLSRVIGRSATDVSSVLEALELEGIATFDERGIHVHESWAVAVMEQMTPLARASLALECADVLFHQHAGPLTALENWRAAELYSAAGERRQALTCALAAADEYARSGFPSEALQAVSLAEDQHPSPEERIAIIRRRAEALHATGNLSDVQAATDTLLVAPGADARPETRTNYVIALCHRADALSKLHKPIDTELRSLLSSAKDLTVPPETRQFVCYTGIRRALYSVDEQLAREFGFLCARAASECGMTIAGGITQLIFAAEFGSVDDVSAADQTLSTLISGHTDVVQSCLALRYRAQAVRYAGFYEKAADLGRQAYSDAAAAHLREIAANAAESLAFLSLDLEDLASADRWLERLEEINLGQDNAQRLKGIHHARRRLAIQREEYDTIAENFQAEYTAALASPLSSQRLSECLTAVFAARMARSGTRCSSEFGTCLEELRSIDAGFLFDYPAELAVRCLILDGQDTEADGLAASYLRDRHARFPRPLAPFYRELAKRNVLLERE